MKTGRAAVYDAPNAPGVIPAGLGMLRVGGRYVLGGIVTPDAGVTLDANLFVRKWITLRGIHNYHPRHLIQALDFSLPGNKDRNASHYGPWLHSEMCAHSGSKYSTKS